MTSEPGDDKVAALLEMRGFLAGIVGLMADPTKPATPDDLTGVPRDIQQMTIIGETEIHIKRENNGWVLSYERHTSH